MANTSESFQTLAAVAPDDLLSEVGEDVIDPSHGQRWTRVSAAQPVLAQEILLRAYLEYPNDPETQKKIIDAQIWVAAVIHNALLRQASTEEDLEPTAEEFNDSVGV